MKRLRQAYRTPDHNQKNHPETFLLKVWKRNRIPNGKVISIEMIQTPRKDHGNQPYQKKIHPVRRLPAISVRVSAG